MTVNEFVKEFKLLYDAASSGAPDINLYEMSVYMTTAQEELVREFYSPKSGSPKDSFENSEAIRRAMSELVKPYSQSTYSTSSRGLTKDSKFFAIPTNVYYIANEFVTLKSNSDNCVDGSVVKVVPTTHDEFWDSYKSPFRKPNARKVWRVDVSKSGSNPLVEIISPEDISEYKMRYVSKPSPIILTDISSGEFAGLGLTIDGKTAQQTCLLNENVHRKILNRAVELAIRDYRENNLRTKIETNNRV